MNKNIFEIVEEVLKPSLESREEKLYGQSGA